MMIVRQLWGAFSPLFGSWLTLLAELWPPGMLCGVVLKAGLASHRKTESALAFAQGVGAN